MKFCEMCAKFCLVQATPSKRDMLSLLIKISQEHAFPNSDCYIDIITIVSEIRTFNIMEFIC